MCLYPRLNLNRRLLMWNARQKSHFIRLLTFHLNINTGGESVYWPKYIPYIGWGYAPFQLASVGLFSGLAMMSQTKQPTSKLAGGRLVARQATRHKINITHLAIAQIDDISSFMFLYYFIFMLFKLWVQPQTTQTPAGSALFVSDSFQIHFYCGVV